VSDEWVQLIVAHDWVDRRNGEKFVTQFVANLTLTGGGGASALADLTDVDVETDPPAPDDVLAWDGTNWTPATLGGGSGLELGETSSTAYRGDRGKTAYDHSQVVTGNPHGTTAADVPVDASGFNGNLTTSDDTVQEVAQKLDDLVIPAAGIADPGGANDDFLQRKAGAWTYRTVAQVKTDLGIGTAPFVLNTPVGQYAGPSAPNTSISNQTDLYLSAGGRGSACLIYLAAGTYDRIGVSLQSAGAAIIRIGLYTAGTDGLPATRVLDAGTIDVSGSTGLREITISQTVTAGWYWASVSADSYTSTFSLYGLNNALAPFIAGGVHYSTVSIRQKPGVASNGFGTSGIPDPFPAVSWSPDGAPKVILRRSA